MSTEHSVKVPLRAASESFYAEDILCTSLEVSSQLRVDVCFSPAWRKSAAPPLQPIRDLVTCVLQHKILPISAGNHLFILECIFSDDAEVCSLNERYRKRKKPTNVLSFAQEDNFLKNKEDGTPLLLGSVILAYETIYREAEAAKKPFAHHCLHLLLHGILHLVGFDHETAQQAQEMEALERRVLATMSIPDPYII
ncbi:MAG: rRNA maturation RNase YbeY [Holosporales bacterium]|jgi:rRNA maturation RNase YbeY|nr:rRNA maturation RNase YbeY [Holosporales bacterium]